MKLYQPSEILIERGEEDAPVVRRAASLLTQLEKNGGPLGLLEAPAGQLPLFAAAAPERQSALDPVHEELGAIDPDRLTPKEALEILYRLKSLIPVRAPDEALPLTKC